MLSSQLLFNRKPLINCCSVYVLLYELTFCLYCFWYFILLLIFINIFIFILVDYKFKFSHLSPQITYQIGHLNNTPLIVPDPDPVSRCIRFTFCYCIIFYLQKWIHLNKCVNEHKTATITRSTIGFMLEWDLTKFIQKR